MTVKEPPVPEMKPIFVMDIDGVLNPDDRQAPGYTLVVNKRAGNHYGRFAQMHKAHIKLFDHIREYHDADFAWATSWVHFPEMLEWYESELGFSAGEVARIDVPRESGDRFGYSYKYNAICEFIGDRPAIWMDDVWGGKEAGWAEHRTKEDGIRTAFIPVESRIGLSRTQIKAILQWLHWRE